MPDILITHKKIPAVKNAENITTAQLFKNIFIDGGLNIIFMEKINTNIERRMLILLFLKNKIENMLHNKAHIPLKKSSLLTGTLYRIKIHEI